MFVPGRLFQPSLIFEGKARSLAESGAPESSFIEGSVKIENQNNKIHFFIIFHRFSERTIELIFLKKIFLFLK